MVMDDTDVINHELVRSFQEIKRSFFKVIRETADSVDVTVPQLMVLYNLRKSPEIGLGELAERLKMTTSTISGVVDRLVKAKLVDRAQSVHDRRAVILKVTEAGNQKLDRAVGPDSMIKQRLSKLWNLPDEDVQTLLRIHQQIINILNQEAAQHE
jgi:DNA-binding MarR family transcriptional regulator